MKHKDSKVYLQDIYEIIERIEDYTKNRNRDQFLDDYEKQDAIIRRLEIIGEAVKRVSVKIKENNPDIPWRQMSGMRDVLVHEYAGVNMGRVWDTVKKDIPRLKKQILKLLKSE